MSVLRGAVQTAFLRPLPNKLTEEGYQCVCVLRELGAKGSRLASERKQALALSKYNILGNDLAK